MRKILLTFIAIALISLAAATAFARSGTPEDVKTARADVAALPPSAAQPDPVGTMGTMSRGFQDVRDSAALVLVGTMLLGLAAAVRRTA